MMSDRIAVMNNGVIQQYAAPSTIFHNPANLFVATFIGSPTMNTHSARLVRGQKSATVHLEGGWSVEVGHNQEAWGSGSGEIDVVLGIRPKDILVSRTNGNADVMQAKVALVEPIGSEAIVHLERTGKTLVAEVSESVGLTPGETVSLSFPKEKLHIFDATSGVALYHGTAKPAEKTPTGKRVARCR